MDDRAPDPQASMYRMSLADTSRALSPAHRDAIDGVRSADRSGGHILAADDGVVVRLITEKAGHG